MLFDAIISSAKDDDANGITYSCFSPIRAYCYVRVGLLCYSDVDCLVSIRPVVVTPRIISWYLLTVVVRIVSMFLLTTEACTRLPFACFAKMLACYCSVGLSAYFDYGTQTFCMWCGYLNILMISTLDVFSVCFIYNAYLTTSLFWLLSCFMYFNFYNYLNC